MENCNFEYDKDIMNVSNVLFEKIDTEVKRLILIFKTFWLISKEHIKIPHTALAIITLDKLM